MKQSTLLVAAATSLLLSGSVVAQTTINPPSIAPRDHMPLSSAAPAEWRIVDSLANAFSFYSSGQDPFAYDPLLNILSFIKRGSPVQAGGGNQVWIWRSNDLGMTWQAPMGPFTDPNEAGAGAARYPSLIVNPTHSTNPNEFLYFFNVPMTAGGDWVAHSSGIVDQSGTAIVPQVLWTGEDPALPSSDALVLESADGSTVIMIGSVADNGIGVRRFNLDAGTVTGFVPPQFSSTVFTVPEEGYRSSVASGLDRDENGAIYALILAETPASVAAIDSMPIPMVSKSTDNGATWSEFITLPADVLLPYLNAQGYTLDSSSTRWIAGFTVLGPDRFSIAMPYLDYRDEGNVGYQLLEMRYNAGNWGIFKIADINGFPQLDGGGGVMGTQVEHEVQLVPTADGSTLVAKWVELIGYTSEEDIDGDGQAPDEFVTTDVMVASRATSQGTWSAKKNVTETPELDRITWIPSNVLPNDLTKLPLLEVQSVILEEDVTQLDKWVNGQIVIADRTQLVAVTNVDATAVPNAAPITGEITESRIASIVPNPTSGSAVLSLDVAKSGAGSVEIFNALGTRVATLASGTLQAGSHTYTLNGVELPVGAYYVAMKIDGQTVTSPFNVVR